MKFSVVRTVGTVLAAGALFLGLASAPEASAAGRKETAVFAGGCYWGVEAVFRHVRGVASAKSGFAVPMETRPARGPGRSDYVEAVRVEYDPTKVTYEQLLEVFFLVAHDPTEGDQQGPDVGPQYRSVVFVRDSGQRRLVQSYLDRLAAMQAFPRPVTTEVSGLKHFREAGPGQQDFVANNPDLPYVIINDAPKVEELKRRYPALYRE